MATQTAYRVYKALDAEYRDQYFAGDISLKTAIEWSIHKIDDEMRQVRKALVELQVAKWNT